MLLPLFIACLLLHRKLNLSVNVDPHLCRVHVYAFQKNNFETIMIYVFDLPSLHCDLHNLGFSHFSISVSSDDLSSSFAYAFVFLWKNEH